MKKYLTQGVDIVLTADEAPGRDEVLEVFVIDQRFGADLAKLAFLPGFRVAGIGR